MRILFFGDIYGEVGEKFLYSLLPDLKVKYHPDVIIVNGENIKNGRGITKDIYKRLVSHGVSAITMGNWTWGNNELLEFINESNIIRPINYHSAPGSGYKVINYNGTKLLVINALGRTFMDHNLENPFLEIKKTIENIPHDYSLVDIHAEATSEKVALSIYLDGLVSAVVGTHTHVQTNDDRLRPKGSLYISDVGMTGPYDGVIGVDSEIVINRFLNGYTTKNVTAKGKCQLGGVFLDLKNKKIERIYIVE